MADVTFFFDPLCPWTWRAGRWLALVADARELDVEWRSFSLELLHDDEGEEVPTPLEVSTISLRLVEALSDAGRNRDAGHFYAALGRRVHEAHEDLDLDLVKAAADDAGVGDVIAAIDDPRWDDAILASYAQALAAAGPDVGSPVVTLPGIARGLHGPILGAVPERDDALEIWDAMTALLRIPDFFEIKRGRPDDTAHD
jgi:2-hydroxychromene-2-carboxylate isomerase